MKIIYLAPDYMDSIWLLTTEETRKAIINHPNRIEYTPEEFEAAFNDDAISDLGYIAVINKNQ